MTAKELKKLNRAKLLRLLLDVQKENEALREKVAQLEQELESKQITVGNAGSIAEAALKISGVFEAAQKAADIYLQNVAPQAACAVPAVNVPSKTAVPAADPIPAVSHTPAVKPMPAPHPAPAARTMPAATPVPAASPMPQNAVRPPVASRAQANLMPPSASEKV